LIVSAGSPVVVCCALSCPCVCGKCWLPICGVGVNRTGASASRLRPAGKSAPPLAFDRKCGPPLIPTADAGINSSRLKTASLPRPIVGAARALRGRALPCGGGHDCNVFGQRAVRVLGSEVTCRFTLKCRFAPTDPVGDCAPTPQRARHACVKLTCAFATVPIWFQRKAVVQPVFRVVQEAGGGGLLVCLLAGALRLWVVYPAVRRSPVRVIAAR